MCQATHSAEVYPFGQYGQGRQTLLSLAPFLLADKVSVGLDLLPLEPDTEAAALAEVFEEDLTVRLTGSVPDFPDL